jgi:hypothetical protein
MWGQPPSAVLRAQLERSSRRPDLLRPRSHHHRNSKRNFIPVHKLPHRRVHLGMNLRPLLRGTRSSSGRNDCAGCHSGIGRCFERSRLQPAWAVVALRGAASLWARSQSKGCQPPEPDDMRSDFRPRRSRRTSMPSKRVPLIFDSSSSACSGVRAAANDCSVTMLA